MWTREVPLGDVPPKVSMVGQARNATPGLGLEVAARFTSGGANGVPPPRRDTYVLDTQVRFGRKESLGHERLIGAYVAMQQTFTWQRVSLPESVSGGGYLPVTTAGHNIILCGGGGGRSTEAQAQASAHGLPCYGYSTTKVGHWLFVFGGSRERATTPTNHLNLLNLGTAHVPCAYCGLCTECAVHRDDVMVPDQVLGRGSARPNGTHCDASRPPTLRDGRHDGRGPGGQGWSACAEPCCLS